MPQNPTQKHIRKLIKKKKNKTHFWHNGKTLGDLYTSSVWINSFPAVHIQLVCPSWFEACFQILRTPLFLILHSHAMYKLCLILYWPSVSLSPCWFQLLCLSHPQQRWSQRPLLREDGYKALVTVLFSWVLVFLHFVLIFKSSSY